MGADERRQVGQPADPGERHHGALARRRWAAAARPEEQHEQAERCVGDPPRGGQPEQHAGGDRRSRSESERSRSSTAQPARKHDSP